MISFFEKRKFGRLLNWYWRSFCYLHQFWNSPLKFFFELVIVLLFVSKAIEIGALLFFGGPIFTMSFLMDEEISALKSNRKEKVKKEEIRNEILSLYAEGQDLKKLLKVLGVSDFASYSLDPTETLFSFGEKIDNWEQTGRDLLKFKEVYPEFWIRMPDSSEILDRIDRYPDQKIYNIFVWRVEKLGKILDGLGSEIRELG